MRSTTASPVNLTVTHPRVRLSDEAITAMARLVLRLASRPDSKPTNTAAPQITRALTQQGGRRE
jgi:hypothetical protein